MPPKGWDLSLQTGDRTEHPTASPAPMSSWLLNRRQNGSSHSIPCPHELMAPQYDQVCLPGVVTEHLQSLSVQQ